MHPAKLAGFLKGNFSCLSTKASNDGFGAKNLDGHEDRNTWEALAHDATGFVLV